MSELKRKQLAFLNETIEHFNSSNRCVDPSGFGCRYEPIEGKSEGCAIGRKIPLELAKKLDTYTVSSVYQQDVFDQLPSELQSLGRPFLKDIQTLHDNSAWWVMTGISEEGQQRVTEIKKAYELC